MANIKDSIVCSCCKQSISHSRGKPCVVIMGFFYRSEKKNIKISRKKLVFKFVHKNSNVNGYLMVTQKRTRPISCHLDLTLGQ